MMTIFPPSQYFSSFCVTTMALLMPRLPSYAFVIRILKKFSSKKQQLQQTQNKKQIKKLDQIEFHLLLNESRVDTFHSVDRAKKLWETPLIVYPINTRIQAFVFADYRRQFCRIHIQCLTPAF